MWASKFSSFPADVDEEQKQAPPSQITFSSSVSFW